MPFMNSFLSVKLISLGGLVQNTWIGAKAQSAADILHPVLVRHKCDDRVGGMGVQFHAVGIVIAGYISGIFHDGKLHAQAKP